VRVEVDDEREIMLHALNLSENVILSGAKNLLLRQ